MGEQDEAHRVEAHGANGVLTVTPTRVLISHRSVFGFITQPLNAFEQVDLPIQRITQVELVEATAISPGYIRFHVEGRPSHSGRADRTVRDPYAIIFRQGIEASAMAAAKDLIEYYRGLGLPPDDTEPEGSPPVGAVYRVTIHSFGSGSPKRIAKILNDFFPEQFPRKSPPPEPPIIVEGSYSRAEGLRLELMKVKASVELARQS